MMDIQQKVDQKKSSTHEDHNVLIKNKRKENYNEKLQRNSKPN